MYGSDALRESDKILISSYVDGELNHDEAQTIEALIESDEEARSYLNQVKMVKNELDSFFNESIESDEYKSASEFIKSRRNSKKQGSIVQNILGIFTLTGPSAAYTAIGILTLSLGLNIFLLNEGDEQVLALSGYSNELVERSQLKTRGVNQTYQKVFQATLLSMHKEKNSLTRLKYGSEIFLIKINNLIVSKEILSCYEGEIKSVNRTNEFVYCINDSDISSFIINDL
jgi:Predicted transmembrane transcriptional regulator (anti-sigma factor)